MKPLRKKIFGFDPYDDFDPAWAAPDIEVRGQGLGVFEATIKAIKPSLIIEVGTWKGASAVHMAKICQEQGLDTEVVCIDTWLGPTSVFLSNSRKSRTERFASMRFVNGYPMLYYTFMRNVVDAGLQKMITPLPQTSENAAKILRSYRVKADMIYIDVSTEKEPVFRDLMFYWPLLRKGGYLIGDNYDNKSLRAGVDKFCARLGLEPEVMGGTFRFLKKEE